MKYVASCFDLDMTNYLKEADPWDEMEAVWPVFRECCERMPEWKTTWFVRIDAHMEKWFGNADHVFLVHADKINWLRSNGHEVGWHFHSYRDRDGKWVQNTDEVSVCEELEAMHPLAHRHGLSMLRMGWAYHTNRTMKTIAELGITMDCTAFPRPLYTWDNSNRNWSETGQNPYFPAKENYQVEGQFHYDLLEVPISTAPIQSPGDTDTNVMRYINPVYFHSLFKKAVQDYSGSNLNLVAHPYEFLPNEGQHNLMSFDKDVMLENLQWLAKSGYEFATISQMSMNYLAEKNRA